MSCTPQETRIMDLWDGGLSTKQIVAQTGLKEDVVEHVVSCFSGRADQRIEEASIRKGSLALLAAIAQVRS